jgi:hypothetical protein
LPTALQRGVDRLVESHETVLTEKNALCTPVPSPERPADWLLMWAVTLANTARWRAKPGLRAWLSKCRLNNMTAVMRGVKPDDSAKLALLQESGAKAGLAAKIAIDRLATRRVYGSPATAFS